MRRQSVDEFLAALSPEQLEEIRTKALFLLRKSSTREEGIAEELYDVLRDSLAAKGVAAPPYPVFLKRSRRVRQFDAHAKELRRFVDRHLQPRCKLERLGAYRTLLRMVERRLQSQSIPLTLQSCLNLLPKIPALVDMSFPGYLASGLLPQVLLRRKPAS